MRLPRTLLLSAAVAGAALAPAAVAQAETVLSVEQRPTVVGAYAGTVMWSQLDPATGAFRLVESVNGGPVQAVGVPERAQPFDVDLGTDRSGATFAVYTRCASGAHGCDIYRLDVATGVEERIAELSSPTADERNPTIQRGEIAFIRREHGSDQLRIGTTTTGSRGSRLLRRARSIVSAELGIRQVAYVVQARHHGFPGLNVHVRNIRTGHDQSVYATTSGGANSANVTKPSLTEDLRAFVWARTNLGSGRGNRLVRYTLRTGRLSYGQGSSSWSSTAWASATLGAATASALDGSACSDTGQPTLCRVALTGPVAFTLRP
jgi:hypothetical protein